MHMLSWWITNLIDFDMFVVFFFFFTSSFFLLRLHITREWEIVCDEHMAMA